MNEPGKVSSLRITMRSGLEKVEAQYRAFEENETIIQAKGTGFAELAEVVIPDKRGTWVSPLVFWQSRHQPNIGVAEICRIAREYLDAQQAKFPMDILSLTAGMEENYISLQLLIRCYDRTPNLNNIYEYTGEFALKEKVKSGLVVPEEAISRYTDEDRRIHREKRQKQDETLENSTESLPFLNAIPEYVPQTLESIDSSRELTYDLATRDMMTTTMLPYQEFIKIFELCMRYITTVEKDYYYEVIRDERLTRKKEFMNTVEAYIHRNYVLRGTLPNEDVPPLMHKIERALFQLYIVQDLIEDPDITDIKITGPNSIRVRVGGLAYISNVTFLDSADYERFITSIAVKNNIDLKNPSQTFTDEHDKDYILRFSLTAPYVTGTGQPIIHIRKVPRKKLMAPDLIEKGMMDEKIRDYLLDCGRHSRGVVFAGPPGSGKTVMLNWFLEEAYEQSAEILVIQENDELFCYRKGVMFEHVVSNPQHGEKACSLEDLGRMALVAGANVFVIGEAKGGEICSAITLSNSGCRTAITIHSPSANETIDKMADLAMRGYATSYTQAKRMIKSFQTIVYLQNFKVQEISEIIGYDEAKEDMIYRPIYRRNIDKTE